MIDLPVTVIEPCGLPEQFFFLPDGATCAEVCGASPVVCDHVQGGCLCKGAPRAFDGGADMDSGQGGIDGESIGAGARRGASRPAFPGAVCWRGPCCCQRP